MNLSSFSPSDKSDPQTYEVIGAAMEVHREMGHGFLESVFQEALEMEFGFRGIPYQSQVEIPVFYKGRKLSGNFRADFICFGTVLVEIKAIAKLTSREDSQVIQYLKGTRHERGLLFNFGTPSLEHKRLIFSQHGTESQTATGPLPLQK